MFCPRCGQEQISNETRFCSRCGFLMTGVGALVANAGNLEAVSVSKPAKVDTPRRRGIKKGLFIFMLAFLVVPILAIITLMIEAREPFAVVIALVLLVVGGLLRIAYAMMFESNEPTGQTVEQAVYETAQGILNPRQNALLSPPQSIPASSYIPPKHGNWRDTNDLEPSSVTDPTTKLLDKNLEQ
jgi:hypothetical protein